MTLITCNSELMASDSMALTGSVVDYNCQKIFGINKNIIAASGAYGKFMQFLEWFKTQKKENEPRDFTSPEISVICLNAEGIWMYEDGLIPFKIDQPYWALGYGAEAAHHLMIRGASPADAIYEVSKFNAYVGGDIQFMTLKGMELEMRKVKYGT